MAYIVFYLFFSFGLVKRYDMPCNVESASLEPKFGNKFIAGGEDMWVRVFDFQTGEMIGKFPGTFIGSRNSLPLLPSSQTLKIGPLFVYNKLVMLSTFL